MKGIILLAIESLLNKNNVRYKKRIRNSLIITYLIPISIFIVLFGYFYYFLSQKSLDEELGKRLIVVAQCVTTQISPDRIFLLREGDEDSRVYKSILFKLKKLQNITNVKRIYLFNKEYKSIADTDESVLIGTKYFKEFDKFEISKVEQGESVASTLFRGNDGLYYKTGYAPLWYNGNVVAFVGVDGSVEFFEILSRIQKNIIKFGIISAIITIIISILFATTIEKRINKLVQSAKKIEIGEMETQIPVIGDDEIGYLARSLDEMRKSILKRDQTLKMMMAGIAHEVRNPLGGMELFIGLLLDELQDKEKRGYVDKIKREVLNLKKLVNDFLDYARPSHINNEKVELKDFFDDIFTVTKNDLLAKNIKVNLNLNGCKYIWFDKDMMKRVFLNLTYNSIDAIEEEGQIDVDISEKNNYYEIKFKDTGKGIDESSAEYLFTPFYTTKANGTGLGLAFVKKIIEEHKGEVYLRNNQDKGATVFIYLPISKELQRD